MAKLHAADAANVLDIATAAGADYADVQFWQIRVQRMRVRNGVVRSVADTSSLGYAVRSLVDGSWGFVGSDHLDKRGFEVAAKRSVAIAKASTAVPDRIKAVKPSEKYIADWTTPFTTDPNSVSLSKRADLLIAAEKNLHASPSVVAGYAFMISWDTDKEFYSTAGSAIKQRQYESGAGCGATAVGKDGDPQTRGGPGDFGLFQGGGYEVIERADLLN